jgi:hypothetical protein
MKHSIFILSLVAAALAGCASFSPAPSGDASQPAASAQSKRNPDANGSRVQVQDEAGAVVVQKVEFKSGISSATVERLAKEHGCVGSGGAGLMTEKGPVEVYRMQCENGKTFLARCELRQCRPMR